ncbi:threonine synthase [Agyrium rufum]|nr:threonine synthase [Agyrium rufum]
MGDHTPSQRYLSTRGGSYGMPFEVVVLKGLASDGGLFIPEAIPILPFNWQEDWKPLSFPDLAYEILSLYISPSEIPPADLKSIIQRSYSTFRHPASTPLVTLDEERRIHLLELFHGPTFAFKDVALQFLGNLFEYFLVRRNEGKNGSARHHLTVIGATSGDTGSAAIYGLRGKKDVSVFILHPKGRVSPIQEAQMTTVLDENVHNVAVEGTFDDCQDIVKQMFADEEINQTHNLGAVNSINWARILAQMTYYFYSYFRLIESKEWVGKEGEEVQFVVPTGNFGDILAGYFARRMGLPSSRLVIATNANDILHRFWRTGFYTKNPFSAPEPPPLTTTISLPQDGSQTHPEGVLETLSPAMDILVSSNFERLLWYLAAETSSLSITNSPVTGQNGETTNTQSRSETSKSAQEAAGRRVAGWLTDLKIKGGFSVDKYILQPAQRDFSTERVSDEETISTIRDFYRFGRERQLKSTQDPINGTVPSLSKFSYLLDPHTAVGITACTRLIAAEKKSNTLPTARESDKARRTHYVCLATAHPAKFAAAVQLALKDEEGFEFERDVLPDEFRGLEGKERRVTDVRKGEGWKGVREVVRGRVPGKGDGEMI